MVPMDDWYERERLHLAAKAGVLSTVQELLNSGCTVSAFDDLGMTPLHYAVLGEHFIVVDWLLRRGANVNAQDERIIGDTPLGEAASTCSLRMARNLVEAGADPTLRGWMQLNAVDRAKRRRQSEGIGSEGHAIYEFLRESVRKQKPRR